MRAAGVSAWRFIFPAAGAAVALGVLTVTVFNPLASVMNAQFERERTALMEGVQSSGLKDIWLRQGDANSQMVVRARSGDDDHGMLRLKNVSLFMFTLNQRGGAAQFTRAASRAERGLADAWQVAPDRRPREAHAWRRGAALQDTLTIPSKLDPRTALERYVSPKGVPFWQLWGAIARNEQAGFSATGYRLQLQELLATPLLFAAMSILAAAFSLRLIRLGGDATLASAGLAIGFFLYFFINQVCSALGRGQRYPALRGRLDPPDPGVAVGVYPALLYRGRLGG